MILVAVLALGLVPTAPALNLLLAVTIFCVYLAPLLLWDEIGEPGALATQAYLLALVLAALVAIRWFNHASLRAQIRRARALAEKELALSQVIDVRAGELQNAAREWRTTFDSVSEAVFMLDAADCVVRANRAGAELVRRELPAMPGEAAAELLRLAGCGGALAPLAALRRSGAPRDGGGAPADHLAAGSSPPPSRSSRTRTGPGARCSRCGTSRP